MILAVLSTVPRPFPRAVRLAQQLQVLYDDPELHIQHGHTPPLPGVDARWRQWYTREELAEAMRDCTALLVHGGSGCIFEALRNDVRPVAVARLARFGEHVDDHQLQLCSRLDASGMLVSWKPEETASSVKGRMDLLPGRRQDQRPDLRPVVWAAARELAQQSR